MTTAATSTVTASAVARVAIAEENDMGMPVVTVAAGGLPVVEAANGRGTPVTEAANGRGVAVTKVVGVPGAFLPGMPVVYVTPPL